MPGNVFHSLHGGMAAFRLDAFQLYAGHAEVPAYFLNGTRDAFLQVLADDKVELRVGITPSPMTK